MKFTFGIITDGKYKDFVDIIIKSIREENIPEYEIIVVGGEFIEGVNYIEFDENIKKNWITKKKNIITKNAKYENIVYMHDYVKLENGWYNGWIKYGENFKACMNIILNTDGSRYRDWALGWPVFIKNLEYLIPYDMIHLSKMMYFSGAYWVAKKRIMEEIPLDESRGWGEAEDAVWSNAYRKKYNFYMNPNSKVRLLRNKDSIFRECSQETIEFLKKVDYNFIKNNYQG